ncbi:MAG TPA: hypothetical protein PK239_03845 [Chitinophagales bacterium]|nr:hypothetical protein [Chitinophagales bacterium]HRK26404.1 hypothetical protein [Chitinophagales bacterium]
MPIKLIGSFFVIIALLQVSCLQVRRVPSYPLDVLTLESGNSEGNCNNGLWQHIHNPARLIIIEPCVTLTGKVKGVHTSPDGDIHLRIAMDRNTRLPINFYNYIARGGCIVAEIICGKPAKSSKGKISCMGYQNALTIPKRGSSVSITGSYVLDTNHGWREIHPVTKLEILK